ncbi:unnamed protein product [Mucor hiemalis]
MSIEPEVPYSYAAEDSSNDNDEGWRDPSLMRQANPAPFGQPQRFNPLDNIVNTNGKPSSRMSNYTDVTAVSDSGHRIPDKILGAKYKSRSNEIQKATGSFIEFNEAQNQVNIWGDKDAIAKTISYLDMIVSRITENDTSLKRKTKKWNRPERELTEKEKRRAEKKQARIDEEKRYQGLPQMSQNYNASLTLLDHSLPLPKLVGENESYLNQIRADCKAFLWYEPQSNAIKIAADTEEAVLKAGPRIRNWYLRCCRKPEGGTIRLMQQPAKNALLNFIRLPAGFVTYEYCDPERESAMLEKQRLLETVSTGVMMRINTFNDLISLEDEVNQHDKLSEQVLTLDERNKQLINQLLSRGLESMRLNDWNLRLKVRFGQICLVDYPKKDNQYLTIEELSDKIFKKALFKSALAPCISKTKAGLNPLLEHLTSEDNCYEFSDNPRTSFVISAKQYPTAAPEKVPGQRSPPRGEMWDTVMKISFTDEGHRKLWNTMTDCKDLVDISCADIESQYSWDLKLQHARQLPNDDVDSPHERFSRALSVSSNNRLIIVTSDDYIPQIWLYSWHDYVVEVCQDEIWDMNRVERTDKELPLDLSPIEPHRSLFKVSFYKEAWVNRLAENLDLKIGEAPTWTLRDFFASPDENTDTLMKNIKEFSEVLSSVVPRYWTSHNSLV